MPLHFDLSSAWEPMSRRRSSLASRRNSLLSLSLFDVNCFGFGGGLGSNRNSLGLGSVFGSSGVDGTDPFAPLSYGNNDIPTIPGTPANDLQRQIQQNNLSNLNALLSANNNTNNGTMAYNSHQIHNITFNHHHHHQTQSATSAAIDRLLGERSEASEKSIPSIITSSTYGARNSADGSPSGFPSLMQPRSYQFDAAMIQHHLQQFDQRSRRPSIAVGENYSRNAAIKPSVDFLSSPKRPARVAADDFVGFSPFSPLSPNGKKIKDFELLLSSKPNHAYEQQSLLPGTSNLGSSATNNNNNNTTSMVAPPPLPLASSHDTVNDDNDDYDDDDDEDDDMNSNRFKPFHEEKWSLRYKELLEFHKEHGHSAVPHTYPPNPQLARWVKRQRRQFKLRKDSRQSTMTCERLDLLNNVGFIWDSHDVNWREKLDSLLQFRRELGHCNVPSNYRDKKLATWVKCQRRQYKLYWDGKPSAMTPERIMELEKVGFEWEIRSTVPRAAAGGATPTSVCGPKTTKNATASTSFVYGST